MKIVKDCYVSVAYTLTVNGEVADKAEATSPLGFIFGVGMLLPKFEENLIGKVVGDKVSFTLSPEEGYGESRPEAIVELPKDIFMVEGKLDTEIIKPGAILPMMDNQGNQMPGTVVELKDEVIVMDFNSPMAGKTLNFDVEVVEVREANEEDMAKFMPASGGCGCGCGEGDDQNDCGEGGCCSSCN